MENALAKGLSVLLLASTGTGCMAATGDIGSYEEETDIELASQDSALLKGDPASGLFDELGGLGGAGLDCNTAFDIRCFDGSLSPWEEAEAWASYESDEVDENGLRPSGYFGAQIMQREWVDPNYDWKNPFGNCPVWKKDIQKSFRLCMHHNDLAKDVCLDRAHVGAGVWNILPGETGRIGYERWSERLREWGVQNSEFVTKRECKEVAFQNGEQCYRQADICTAEANGEHYHDD